jgi:hypothetical protein
MDQVRELQAAERNLIFMAEGEHLLNSAPRFFVRIFQSGGAGFHNLLHLAVQRHAARFRLTGKLQFNLRRN